MRSARSPLNVRVLLSPSRHAWRRRHARPDRRRSPLAVKHQQLAEALTRESGTQSNGLIGLSRRAAISSRRRPIAVGEALHETACIVGASWTIAGRRLVTQPSRRFRLFIAGVLQYGEASK
jgi:hypothetical protein